MIDPISLIVIGGLAWGAHKAITRKPKAVPPPVIKGNTLQARAQSVLQAYRPLLTTQAARLGIAPEVAAAVATIEGGGKGFGADGRLLIRFEPKKFLDFAGVSIPDSHANQSAEYAAFQQALAVNENEAYRAISMGVGQIMGFNAKKVGYPSAAAMFEAFQNSIEAQFVAIFEFVLQTPTLLTAARNQDWPTFARKYNGSGYAANKYDVKLAEATAAAKEVA